MSTGVAGPPGPRRCEARLDDSIEPIFAGGRQRSVSGKVAQSRFIPSLESSPTRDFPDERGPRRTQPRADLRYTYETRATCPSPRGLRSRDVPVEPFDRL